MWGPGAYRKLPLSTAQAALDLPWGAIGPLSTRMRRSMPP